MKRHADHLFICLFIGMLFMMSVMFIIWPKEQFSDMENRVLARKPSLSWQAVISKQFMEQAERYVVDHFPFRSGWVKLKSSIEQLRLQRENNDIYMGKDGYLFEKFDKPDMEKLNRYTGSVRHFVEAHPDVRIVFTLAPNSISMYPERLPWLASAFPQEDVHRWVAKQLGVGQTDDHGETSTSQSSARGSDGNLTFIDGLDVLRPHANEHVPIYYRTDHHWTTYGAYLAYVAYAKQMGWQPHDEQDYNIKEVSQSFLGSYHTRGQFTQVNPDTITEYEPHSAIKTIMTIVDTGETRESLYDDHYLETKDQYSYFLGGVHALLVIHNEWEGQHATNESDPSSNSHAFDLDKLLIIKDSYAHNMVPFLTHHVKDIHVVDLRYYNGKVSDYLYEHQIEDVLLLFNTASYVENNDIMKLR